MVEAINTQPGMVLSVGPDEPFESLYSVSATSPENETITLNFPRRSPYKIWRAVISFYGIPLIGQSVHFSSCASQISLNYTYWDLGCVDGYTELIISWKGAIVQPPLFSLIYFFSNQPTIGHPLWPLFVDAEEGSFAINVTSGKYFGDMLPSIFDDLIPSFVATVNCPVPTPPKLKVSEVGSDYVILKIDSGGFTADFYQLYISEDGMSWQISLRQEGTKMEVSQLLPKTTYYFTAAAGVLPSMSTGRPGPEVLVTTKK